MGADAAAFAALSERVAELERLIKPGIWDPLEDQLKELQASIKHLEEEVFGRDVHEAVLGEQRPPEPRLEQPKRTR